MKDLNNIYYFAKIVECEGLTGASEALGVAKSVLSQHLSRLETELGVRLLQRNTRRLQITDIGIRYYERCRAILSEVDEADRVIDSARDRPRGKIRIAAQINFAQAILTPVFKAFMAEYPEVEIALDFTNREVDLIAEGYDLALRIGPNLQLSTLVARSFTINPHVLVASPDLLVRLGTPTAPQDLKPLPSIAGVLPPERSGRYVWALTGPGGAEHAVHYTPRLVTDDLYMIKEMVLAGLGATDLPPLYCREELADGRLVHLLPQWALPSLNLHAVYPSRLGLTLAVRTVIDFLAAHLGASWLDATQNRTPRLPPPAFQAISSIVG